MATIQTKEELTNLAESKFPDNGDGDITAQDLREFVQDFVASNLSLKRQVATSTPVAVLVETDLLGCDVGSSVIDLPTAAGYKERNLIILNDSGGTITINTTGGDLIEGAGFITLENQSAIVLFSDTISNWRRISKLVVNFLQLLDTPNDYTGQALKSVRVNAGETGLEFGEPSPPPFTALTDTPTDYSGASLQDLRVNAGETALEFYTKPAKKWVNAYEEDNALTTNIISASTFTDINCNLLGSNADFTVSGNQITYIGIETINAKIDFHATLDIADGSEHWKTKVFKNGATPLNGQAGFESRDGGGVDIRGDLSITTSTSLSTNDTIELRVANFDGTNDCMVEQLTIFIQEL